MWSRAFRWAVLGSLTALALACGSDRDPATSDGGAAGSGGEGGEVQRPDALAFELDATELGAGETKTFRVRATPPGNYPLRFALVTADGDAPGDAVLDRLEAVTRDDGFASVALTAPTMPAEFVVRASAGGDQAAELAVTVREYGTTSLNVLPAYGGHRRRIGGWVATAQPDASCADRAGIPPPDGELIAFSPGTGYPTLQDVPLHKPLAVTLRTAQYAGGCVNLSPLETNAAAQVTITIVNRPMDLPASEIEVSLALQYPDRAFPALLERASAQVSTALLGTSSDDADALLDAVRQKLSGTARTAFDSARAAEGWDNLLRAAWGAAAPLRVRATVDTWLEAARAGLGSSGAFLNGSLTGLSATMAELDIAQAFGLDATDAGVVEPTLITWSADSHDTLLFGGELYFIGTELLTALARTPALSQYPEAESASDALALDLDCNAVGTLLASAGADPVNAYATCEAACMAASCVSAVETLWQRAREAGIGDAARLTLSATGDARVGDDAELAGVSGAWVGELSLGGDSRPTTGGSLSGGQPVME